MLLDMVIQSNYFEALVKNMFYVLGSSLDDQNTGKELSAKTTPKKPSPETTTKIETFTGKDYVLSVPSNHKSKDEKCLDSVR